MPGRLAQLQIASAVFVAAAAVARVLNVDLGFEPRPLLSWSTALTLLFVVSYWVAMAHLGRFGRLWLLRSIPPARRWWYELVLGMIAVMLATVPLVWLVEEVF